MTPLVSIVVSTTNRAKSLRRLLASLEVQDYWPFEVVVVVGPCDDGTHALLDEYQGRVVVCECHDRNLSRSRNIGVREARGEFVCFLDDDAVPDPLWIRQLLREFAADDIGVTGGKTLDYSGVALQAAFSWTEMSGASHVALDREELAAIDPTAAFAYPIGTNAMFRRKALMEVGGFDEEIEYCHDETDVVRRLFLAGYRFEPSDEAFVIHEAAPSHLRATDVHPDRYPVIKNWMYFALKHGIKTVGARETVQSILAFVENEARAAEGRASATPAFNTEAWEAFLGQVAASAGRAFGRWYSDGCRTRPMPLVEPRPGVRELLPFRQTQANPLQVVVLMPDYGSIAPGGIERVYRDISRELAARGHGVHVITGLQAPPPPGVPVTQPSVWFVEDAGYWLHRVAPSPLPPPRGIAVSSAMWAAAEGVRAEVEMLRERGRIDVVLAPNWGSWALGVALEGMTPVVLGVYTPLARILELDDRFDRSDPDTASALEAEALTLRHAAAFALTSEDVAADIERLYGLSLAAKPSNAAPLGLAPTAWHGPARCHHSLDDCRRSVTALDALVGSPRGGSSSRIDVAFVGRHEPRKGLDVMLKAFSYMADAVPGARLLVAGRDDIVIEGGRTYRELWSEDLGDLEASGRLVFLGELTDCQLTEFYARADVVVMPSRYESFGLVLLEAMASGAVPVATDTGGVPTVVPREWGTLVPVDDADALAATLIRLATDSVERARIRTLGLERATQILTIGKAVDSVEGLLRSVSGMN